MAHRAARHNRPVHDELHPLVYKSMIGLTIWLVFSIWVLFGSGAYFGLTLAMISLFFLIVTAIPVLIWLTWRRNAAVDGDDRSVTGRFSDWTGEEFSTWTGGLSGREAAMQILLPLAAVSIGMTIFGLVFYLNVPHGAF